MSSVPASEFKVLQVLRSGIFIFYEKIFLLVGIGALIMMPTLLIEHSFSGLELRVHQVLSEWMKILIFLLNHISYIFFNAVLSIFSIYVAFKIIIENKIHFSEYIKISKKKFFRVFAAALFMLILGCFGLLLFVAPFFFVLVVFFLVTPIIVFENHSVIDSIKRSLDLTKGYRWKIFELIFLSIFLLIVVTVVFYVPINFLLSSRVVDPLFHFKIFGISLAVLVWHAASVASSALFVVLQCVVYFRIRADKEGYRLDRDNAVLT